MNTTQYFLLGITLSLGLSACDDVDFRSILIVQNPLKLVSATSSTNCDDQVDWWNCSKEPETLLLTPGSYSLSARLGETSKTTKLLLEIPNSKNTKQVITIESSRKLSSNDQTFSLSPEEINQEFALNGNIVTQYENGPHQNDVESCTYTTREYVCREKRIHATDNLIDKQIDKRNDHNHRPPHRPPPTETVCGYETVTHYGRQYVEFYVQYITKTLSLSFIKENSEAASSVGNWHDSNKIYTHIGICR